VEGHEPSSRYYSSRCRVVRRALRRSRRAGGRRRPANFDCTKDRSPLALTVCNDRQAAAAERRTTASYLTLHFQLGEGSRSTFRADHLQWLQGVTGRCPPRPFGPGQLALSTQCVRQLYAQRADLYRKKLSGAVLEEVNLPLALLKKVQKRLIELTFLFGSVDGMFGADTRAAIRHYQGSIGHPQGTFLSAQERTMLLEGAVAPALASMSSSKEAPVAASEPPTPAAAGLRPSIQEPQSADKRQLEPNTPDRTVAQADQQNTPDTNLSAPADATGSVQAGSNFQERYFIAGALLAVLILAFAAVFVFIRSRRRSSRTNGLDEIVAIDPSAGVLVKKESLRVNPYVQVNAPLAPDRVVELHLKEASKS